MRVIIYYYNTDKATQGYQFVNASNLSNQEKGLMETVMRNMGATGKRSAKLDKEGVSVRYEPVQVNNETQYFFCAVFRPKSNRGIYSRGYIQYVGFLLDGKEADELFSHPYSALERVMRQEAEELLNGKEQRDAFQRITEKLETVRRPPALSAVSENAMRAMYIGATYTTQPEYQTVFYEAEAEEQIRSLEHLFQELPIPLRKTVSFFRNALDLEEVFGAALCFFRLPQDDVIGRRGAYRTKYNFRHDSLDVPPQAANQDTVKVWLDGEYAQDIRKQTREYFRVCDWNGYTIKNMWAYYAQLSAALTLEDRHEWERQVLDVVGEENFRIAVTERKILYPPMDTDRPESNIYWKDWDEMMDNQNQKPHSYGLTEEAIDKAAQNLQAILDGTEVVKMNRSYLRVQDLKDHRGEVYKGPARAKSQPDRILCFEDAEEYKISLDLELDSDKLTSCEVGYDKATDKCYFIFRRGKDSEKVNTELTRNRPTPMGKAFKSAGDKLLPRYIITWFGGDAK